MTLGQVVKFIEKYNFLNNQELILLQDILTKRNDLVHQYFKRIDIEEQDDNNGFVVSQTNYLSKFYRRANHLNDRLCQIIDVKDVEFLQIKDV